MDAETTNGALTPPVASGDNNAAATSGTKRKRSPASDSQQQQQQQQQQPQHRPQPTIHEQAHPASAPSDTKPQIPIDPIYKDILEVFKKYDTTPSVLEHVLPESARLDAPSIKRVKLANGDSASTISSKVKDGSYSSLQQLQRDIQHVCASIIEPIKSRERQRNGARLPPDDIKTMQHVLAFQHKVNGFLTREGKKEDKPKTNGQVTIDDVKNEDAPDDKSSNSQTGKTILTLFGNAPTPRQLFSSFQHAPSEQNASIKAEGVDLSLEELGLPNMLNATKVVPLDPHTALGSRPKEPTFADIFPAPPTLPQLNPPKAKSNTRSASINWLAGDSLLPKPSRKNAYTMQPLNVGSWLDYGGRDADRESSGAIKRRRRESIVSTAPPQKSFQDMSPAEVVAQEEALFKAAYSSFAPSTDNSRAIVPQEVRDRVWWHKVGQKRFDKHFVLDPALDSSFPPALNGDETAVEDDEESATLGGTDELREFQDAVDNFDEDAFQADRLISTINHDERSVEDTLQEISGLLETLASYQRIRNSYLTPASSRNPTSPSPSLATAMGTPTEPTKEEFATYKSLRAQLARLIARLPPYAVAKLDGEQLEDLAVSKTIIIEGKEIKGSMEEDQLTRMIRNSAAMQAAAGPASVARPTTEYKSTASTYGRTSSSTMGQGPRSAHAPNPAYYGARTPATNFNRSTAAVGAPSYATPSATAPRPSYSQVPGYANTAARQQSYGQTQGQGQANGQPQGYRPGYGYGSTLNSQQTPQATAQTPAGYPVQQTQFRNSAAYNQNAGVGTPSYNTQRAGQAGQNYGAAAATPFMQQRSNGQPQQSSVQQPQQPQPNSGRATPHQGVNPQTPSALGPSGFHTSMTSEQQQIMMERQRAQLAQQPLARMQAQNEVQRVASVTPQPAQQQQQQNGDAGRGVSATPMVA